MAPASWCPSMSGQPDFIVELHDIPALPEPPGIIICCGQEHSRLSGLNAHTAQQGGCKRCTGAMHAKNNELMRHVIVSARQGGYARPAGMSSKTKGNQEASSRTEQCKAVYSSQFRPVKVKRKVQRSGLKALSNLHSQAVRAPQGRESLQHRD